MHQPEGFAKGTEHLVCKLKRSIYRLKQSPVCWNSVLDAQLKQMGFVQTTSDPCLYVSTEGELCIVAVYVDDVVIAGKSDEKFSEVKKSVGMRFKLKDMGELHYFLGMKIIQDHKFAYTENVLQKFDIMNAKEISTPVDPSTKLFKETEESDAVSKTLSVSNRKPALLVDWI